MKAYQVMFKDSDWCDIVHAETARKSKSHFWAAWNGEDEFINIRTKRVPELDGKKLTGQSVVDAGYDESWLDISYFICDCEICKPNKIK